MGRKQGLGSDAAPPAPPQRTTLRRSAPDSFGTYHDLIQASGSTASRFGAVFEATVTAYSFPRLMMFDRHVVGAEHHRDRAQIRRDGFEHYYLQVVRSGGIVGGGPDQERWLLPGDAVLFDATQPQRSRVAHADYVNVILERDLVEATVPNASRLHGRILSRAAGSIGDVVLSLVRRAPSLDAGSAAAASGLITGLLDELAAGEPVPTPEGHSEAELARRLQADLFIEAHLGRGDLNVGTIAAGIGISRSALYRAFKPMGGIEREIVRRRVARLRLILLKHGETRSIDALAYALGFATPSHCSRIFKEVYGIAPDHLRAEARDARTASDRELRVDLMHGWYKDLNVGGDRG